MSPITVVGAGPAGLMAAWRLAAADHECVVHEARRAVGGMAGSFEVAGQRVDYGSHRLHPATPPHLLARIEALLGDELQVRERNGRIRLHGRWVAFPLRLADLVTSLPPRFSASVGVDTISRAFRHGKADSFLEEVNQRMGPTVARDFYGPYAEKLYGVPAESLAAEQASRRIAVSSPVDVFRRLLGSGRGGGRTFLYPRRGYGAIVERLADEATAAGAEIRLDAPVERIDPDGTTLFTGPVPLLAGLLGDAVPPEVAGAIKAQRMRAMVLVYLALPVDRYTPFDAHYLPGPETRISRLSEPKNYRDGPDPAGQTVLCAELPCWRDDATWNASAAELGETVVADLDALGLPRAAPFEVEVRRLPSVYPVYERHTAADRAAVRAWLRSLEAVLVFGRQGLAVPDNLHHVLDMGWSAAGCVRADGSVDRSVWSEALDRFETHVVED